MSSYSDYADSASRILQHKGEALGRSTAAKGDLWGSTIAQLGTVIPQQVQQAMRQAAERRKTETIQRILQESNGDLEQAIPRVMGIDTELGSKLLKQHTEIKRDALEWQKLDWEMKKAQTDLDDRMLGTINDEDSYARYVFAQKQAGRDVSKLPPQYDPAWVKQQKIARLSFKDQLELENPSKQLQRVETMQDGVAGTQFVAPEPGAFYPSAPKPGELVPTPGPNGPVYGAKVAGAPVYEKESTAGGGSDYAHFLDRFAKDKGKTVAQLTTAEELQARKQFGQADDRPPTTIRLDSGMTPGQEFDAVMKLSNAYQREVKAAKTVEQQLGLMRASMEAVRKGNMAAGSQGVLVTFQKILDPISVVRESEYARSASGLSLMSRLEGAYTKLAQGGAGVKPDDLQQFLTLAEQFAKNQEAFAKQTKARTDAVAKKYKLDPSLVTDEIAAPLETAPPPPAQKKANPFR